MILNVDDEIFIDVDKISAIMPKDKFVVLDGCALALTNEEQVNIILKAYKQNAKAYMYDKELKKIRGEKE